MSTATEPRRTVVSHEQWLLAREQLLAKEKELTHLNDALARERSALPWTRVEEDYVFAGPNGGAHLADLFAGRSQLAVYHFMFGPDWQEGCPGCSYLMDHMNGAVAHLAARDVSWVLVSRGPIDRLMAFQKRMGWHFTWVSSGDNGFNRDFGVQFTKQEVDHGAKLYNFNTVAPHGEENPGLSCFYRNAAGEIFHTYSCYARGLEPMLGTYAILDRVAKGRDEDHLKMPMEWVRHHDKYAPALPVGGSCCHAKECH